MSEPNDATGSDLPSDAEWEQFTRQINEDVSIRPLGPRDWIEQEDPEEGYEPPAPPPVFTSEPLLILAWTLTAGAPALMMVTLIGWRAAPPLVYQALALAFLAGLGLLLWRMPKHRSRSDDDDHGAVV